MYIRWFSSCNVGRDGRKLVHELGRARKMVWCWFCNHLKLMILSFLSFWQVGAQDPKQISLIALREFLMKTWPQMLKSLVPILSGLMHKVKPNLVLNLHLNEWRLFSASSHLKVTFRICPPIIFLIACILSHESHYLCSNPLIQETVLVQVLRPGHFLKTVPKKRTNSPDT